MPSASLSKSSIDQAPGTLLITDIHGIARYANEGVSRRTGFALPEILGRKPGTLWGGRMPRGFYRHLWHTIEKLRQPFHASVENVRKQGQRYHEPLSVVPLLNARRQPEYFLAIKPPVESGLPEFFLEMFNSRVQPESQSLSPQLAPWLLRSLGLALPVTTIKTPAALLRFVQQVLIAPLEERYADREVDARLVQAAQDNPEAFRALYEKYQPLVSKYFFRHLAGSSATAQDLTQETFLRAFRHLSRFRGGQAAYGTYLLRIAHNLLVNHFRRQSESVLPTETLPDTEAMTDDPLAAAGQSLDWLSEVQTLRPVERRILTLYYEGGYSVREIARRLGKSDNAVKLSLSRSRRKLRTLLVA